MEAGAFDRVGEKAAVQILPRVHVVTAIVTSSDVVALSAITAATGLGLSLQGDVSVIGFDGITEPALQGLTTIC